MSPWFLLMSVAAAQEPAAAPPCTSTTTEQLSNLLAESTAAFASVDLDRFLKTSDTTRGALPCLSEELPRALAAKLHRQEGLRRFVDQDPAGSEASFAAARAIEPRYSFPTTVLPSGNPVLEHYYAANLADGTRTTVPAPTEGRLQLDGRLSLERSDNWPHVVQLFEGDGSVATTAYLDSSAAWLAYDALPMGQSGKYSYDGGGPSRVPFLASGGGTLAAGLVVMGAAGMSKRTWSSGEVPVHDLDARGQRTNLLGGLGLGLTAVGLSIGVTGLVIGE